jgi:thiosulfate dehydrogenase [quinone] large subunit
MNKSWQRYLIYVLAAVAIVTLAVMIVPQLSDVFASIHTPTVWAFWISFIALVVMLFFYRNVPGATELETEGPPFARFLFNNSAAGLFWLPIRVFVGVTFLNAGLHKLGDPGWTQGGASLLGFWNKAVAVPDSGSGQITYEWYRDFINLLINNHTQNWFAWLVLLGEIAIGLGLIFGALTGIAAFFGALMNMSFLLAGSASVNPVLFTMGVGLMLAWKVAGYYGVDRWLLPLLGTPWRKGALINAIAEAGASSEATQPST